MEARRRRTLGLAVVLAMVCAAGCGSAERKIARRLEELFELVEKDGEESALAAAARAREVAAFFGEGFEVIAAPLDYRTTDRAGLTRTVLGYRRSARRIVADVGDREISVDEAAARATTRFTARFRGEGAAFGPADAYVFRFSWVEEPDGVWRVDQAELLAIERSGF